MKKFTSLAKKLIKIPVLSFYRIFVLFTGVDQRIILFESNLGRNYSGNPRFIYEEMVAQGLDDKYRCYFILEKLDTEIPGKAIKIKRKSLTYFKLFAKAGFWVSDTRMPAYLLKRKKTIYIQTWHGTPLKRLALDMFDISMDGQEDLKTYKKEFIKNVNTWDYLISQNAYSSEIFRRAFAFNKEILEIGYPRNDILINKNKPTEIFRIKQSLSLPADKKIILYAPTWRDNEHLGNQLYRFSSLIDVAGMQKALSDEYILIMKAHYLVGEKPDFSDYSDFVYQFGPDVDIAELYLISDILVTDYSSVMFDYSLLRRPMLFYAYDLEHYQNNLRGFYFDFISEAPGPVVTTSSELIAAIQNYSYENYKEKYEAFVSKFNHADDGRAAKRIVDLIISHGGK